MNLYTEAEIKKRIEKLKDTEEPIQSAEEAILLLFNQIDIQAQRKEKTRKLADELEKHHKRK